MGTHVGYSGTLAAGASVSWTVPTGYVWISKLRASGSIDLKFQAYSPGSAWIDLPPAGFMTFFSAGQQIRAYNANASNTYGYTISFLQESTADAPLYGSIAYLSAAGYYWLQPPAGTVHIWKQAPYSQTPYPAMTNGTSQLISSNGVGGTSLLTGSTRMASTNSHYLGVYAGSAAHFMLMYASLSSNDLTAGGVVVSLASAGKYLIQPTAGKMWHISATYGENSGADAGRSPYLSVYPYPGTVTLNKAEGGGEYASRIDLDAIATNDLPLEMISWASTTKSMGFTYLEL